MHSHTALLSRFAQYNAWFNERVYDTAAALSDEERRRDLGAFFHSVHGTLAHILLADRLWLGRFARAPLGLASLENATLAYEIETLGDILYDDFEELRRERRATDAVISAFVRELTPELIASNLDYRNTKGQPFSAPIWHILAHVFNHQTHHRGQVTTLFAQLGRDVGGTDFMVTAFMPEPG